MPTVAQLIAALEANYASTAPRYGDVVNLRQAGTIVCRAHITNTDPRPSATDSEQAVAFEIGSVTYYAMIYGLGGAAPRTFVAAFTLDTEAEPPQVVPEASDLATALISPFDEENPPREGDTVLLTYSSQIKFRATLTETDLSAYTVSDASLFCIELAIDTGGEDPEVWFATLVQLGLF
ncbi:MAG: hypothetical protein C0518_05610 [Opitutus sp.]|nr:hypothetical protein [Opitutus sp.]